MKRILHSFAVHTHSGQKGQALLITLVFLAVASLILAPLLALMATGARTQTAFMDKTRELYAADAGIDYGIWKIKDNPDAARTTADPYILPAVNDLPADVWIELLGTFSPSPDVPEVYYNYYKVTSSAGGTTVEAKVRYRAGPTFFDKAVTSTGDVSVHGNKTIIDGDVVAGGKVTYPDDNIKGDVFDITDGEEVKEAVQLYINIIDPFDVAETARIKTYVQVAGAENVTIYNDGLTINDSVTFNDPVIVNGDLKIQKKDVVVTFNSTLYVSGNFTTTANATVKLEDTVYIGGYLDLKGGAHFVGQQLVVVMGDIKLTGGGELVGDTKMPFILTPTGSFDAHGGGYIYAGIYAAGVANVEPDPDSITGGTTVVGVVVCDQLHMTGGSTITYGGDALKDNYALMEMLGFDKTKIVQYKVIP